MKSCTTLACLFVIASYLSAAETLFHDGPQEFEGRKYYWLAEWKLEANTVRTVLIHTMLHTRNTLAHPWRQGLQLGAAPCGEGVCIYMKSDEPYSGRLQFDVPRHRLTFGFQQDWPRMNAVPEWFTVEPDEACPYEVYDVERETRQIVSGKSLAQGLPVQLEPDRPLRIVVIPK